MRMLFLSLLLALGVASVGPATAGPFEDAKAAYQAGDYAEALRWYRLAAEQGNVPSQVSLGFFYEFGEGVVQDYAEAARWYRLGRRAGRFYGPIHARAHVRHWQGGSAGLRARAYVAQPRGGTGRSRRS